MYYIIISRIKDSTREAHGITLMTGDVPKTCKQLTKDNVTAKHMWTSFQISQNKGQDSKTQWESRILHVARLMSLSQ